MKELSEQQKEKLSRTLAKGKWRYVILYGVLMWGVMTAILYRVLTICWDGNKEPFLGQFLSAETALALIIFPVTGIGFGLVMWK
ncbi:MAG: hypothetical protein PHY02_08620 [Phycisphaerae bacterium]|nr:hypothetical protein [Phycisphaerae bacterium]